MKPDCPFCNPAPDQVFLETDLILGLWDRYPGLPTISLPDCYP